MRFATLLQMAGKHSTFFSQKDFTYYDKWLRVAKWQGFSQFICAFRDISEKMAGETFICFGHRNTPHIMMSN